MKKLITGLLLATTFAHTPAYSHNQVWDFERLGRENPAFEEAKRQGFTVIENTPDALTTEETKTTKLEEVSAPSSDRMATALQYGAAITGMAVTYLYGPAALFWGTYYTTSFMLGKIGITGLTGIAAATNAGLMIANSTVANAGLVTAGGFISHYGPGAVKQTGKVALSVGKFAATTAWSFGKSAYSYVWGNQSQQSAAQEGSLEVKRARHLDAIEKRLNLAAAAA